MKPEPATEEEIVETQAVAVRDNTQAVIPAEPKLNPAVTAAQAKIEAIANLTMSAYQKAATLQLTKEEIGELQADFPDDAFQPGAAGKEHLIYIEHAHLRDRLNRVFGPGQWAIIPRNRWAEPFRTKQGDEGSRVYVEAMLVVRGAFVAEAVGAMEYYPKNAAQNYGDAVEGAKTAALRRCAKELGIGLQAWKKEWCEGWWQRRRGPRQTAPKSQPMAPVKPPAPVSPAATDAHRTRMISLLEPARDIATEYFRKIGQLMPNESLEDLPLRFVPATKEDMSMLSTRLSQFGNGEPAEPAFPAGDIDEPPEEEDNVDTRPSRTGTLERITEKHGKSKKGDWTLYGLKVGEDWFNTFDKTLAGEAKALEGHSVILIFEKDEKGNKALEIRAV